MQRPNPTPQTHGFALVSALAVMTLVLLITFTLVTTSTSELFQTNSSQGLVRARALAEASVAQATATLVNDGVTQVNTVLKPYVDTFASSGQDAASADIVPVSAYPTVVTQLNSTVKSNASVTAPDNGGSAQGSVVFRNFRLDKASRNKEGQTYYVDYELNGTGTSGKHRRNVETTGTLRLVLGRQYLNQYVLLADDGGFTQGNCWMSGGRQFCNGGGFFGTGNTFDGPVHFNKNVAFRGNPRFNYGVTVASPTNFMYDCVARAYQVTASQTTGCTTPDYGGYGKQHVSDTVPLPTNAFSQGRAALGLNAGQTGALTNSEICQAIGQNQNCTPASGVYVPRSGSAVKGGIFIQGDAQDVQLSVNGQNQVYTVTGANNVVTRIEVNYGSNTTTVTTGNQVTNLTGVPNGQLYANGSIRSLRGPARTGAVPSPSPALPPTQVPPALAAESKLNIASSGDVRIQGDLTYTEDPRTVPDAKNVLGIISGSGNVLVGTGAPNDVYIMGSILAGGSGKGLLVEGIDNPAVVYGARGKLNLLGSLAENTDPLRAITSGTQTVKGYDDSFAYDKRFLNGGAVPPYFPATTKFTATTFWPKQNTWDEK